MTLVYPKNGEYRSAIITKDFTGDGSKDALGFYALEDRSVAVQFLLKDGDAWRTAGTFQNTATQVDRVCFADLNGDGRQDVLIGWGSTAGTTGRTAAVSAYLFSEGEITEYPLGTYGEMAVTDFDGDGVNEVFTIDKYLPPEGEEGEASPAMARVYRFVAGQVRAVASAEADNSITNYTALSFGKLSAQLPGVAVDGAKADGSMTTQLFFFDGQGSLQNLPEGVNGENYQNPFSRPSTTSFTCRDINEDGILEFPAVSLLPGISSDVTPDSTSYLVEWRTLDKNGDFRAVLYAMMNPRENYWFRCPCGCGSSSPPPTTPPPAPSPTPRWWTRRRGTGPSWGRPCSPSGCSPARPGRAGARAAGTSSWPPRGTWSTASSLSPRTTAASA